MNKYELIADSVANPAIITSADGTITHMNEGAAKLMYVFRKESCGNINELCPNLTLTGGDDDISLSTELSNLKYFVSAFSFPTASGELCRLYIFEDNVTCSKLVSQVLEAIDEGVSVIDSGGNLETFNDTALKYIGWSLNDRNEYIGENLQQALRRENLLSNALSQMVIKERRVIKKNLEYTNGKVITYTGTPIFDDERNLKHVVLTGRDVSRLVQLESQLDELEKIKNDYYSQLMELEKTRGVQGPICSSKRMEYVLGIASKVASTDAPIFLTGESGVGKEEVARFIHRNSDRSEKPFIAINCAAIPEQLMESELFGFTAGSFTGANKNGKKGLLDEANGGTFFLDEIGELPFAVQSKLLRVVQDGRMYPIGGIVPIDLDVRFISATNLSEEVLGNSAKFRRDLYYRLCVVPLHIPPLRERKDDIIPLISYFLELFNKKYRKSIRISNQVLRKMTRLDWPGNVRELKNVVERLVILSSGAIVDDSQLKIALDMGGGGTKEKLTVNSLMPLSEAHDLVDSILINEAYSQYGTIVETAKALRIDPSTIHRKIKDGKLVLDTKP
ncbi:MAG: sigma 54-interacting transcriptional regulator [Oscillospiraceae bacterium]|nr:sigma 54-interacting transcriptional regulator [Oscillospiraceae bacterium]